VLPNTTVPLARGIFRRSHCHPRASQRVIGTSHYRPANGETRTPTGFGTATRSCCQRYVWPRDDEPVTRQRNRLELARLLPAMLLGVVAFTFVLVITELPGPGLDPDALQYMGAAESVAAHGVYRVPKAPWDSPDSTEALAHFPPGYSTVLALPLRLGMEPAQGARLVQATAAFVTVTTLGLLVAAVASQIVAILLVLALFGMTSMHEVHASVLSEPVYLACMTLVLAAMVQTPDRPWRTGIPAAVGVMTRYAGASLVGAVTLWALMQQGTWVERVRRAAIALLPALVLQGAWVMRTRTVARAEDIRKFALYGNLKPTLVRGGKTLTAWLIPDPHFDRDLMPHRTSLAIAAGFSLAVLVGIGAWRVWRASRAAETRIDSFAGRSELERDDARVLMTWRLFSATALLLVCYLGVVGVSRLLADPDIPFDERILSPALLLLMTLAAVGLSCWWRGTRLRSARAAVCVALLAWWCAAGLATRSAARFALTWGSDLAGQQWRESELLSWARTEGAGSPLYSNWPAVVYFHVHRPVHELPLMEDLEPSTLTEFADTVRARRARVLLFDVATGEVVPNDSLLKTRGLRVLERLNDGVVLGPDP
jgi:hypothetical protein